MLTRIGRGSPKSQDLVELLLECHGRIRRFTALAAAIGQGGAAPEAEVVDACRACERYFEKALPLHVQDEEQSVLPRLSGLDDALAAMAAQHARHEPLVAELLEASRAVRQAPADPALRARLAAAAAALATEFDEHLALEERLIFPAVREQLSAAVQAEIVAELRARRAPG